MLEPHTLTWLVIAGSMVTFFSAIGSRVLRNFSHRDLELYCRSRQKERFDEIILYHLRAALVADTFLAFGVTLSVFAAGVRLMLVNLPGEVSFLGLLGSVAVASGLLLAITTWIPIAIAANWGAVVVFHTWRIWRVASYLALPLTSVAQLFDKFGRRISGRDRQSSHDEEEAFEDEIRSIVNAGLREGLLEEDAREMIEGVIELGDVDVADVMTPRSKVDAIDAAWDWSTILEFVVRVKRTRIPVYRDSLDNVVGVLYVKDLLPIVTEARKDVALESLLRETWQVPAQKAVDDLLREFLDNRHHIAIVLDEYDAIRGVVTIEDALELIVGEIRDEHETESDDVIPPWNKGQTEVNAAVHLDDLAETLGVEFPRDVESDTIGGLMVERLGRIPEVGEAMDCGDLSIQVVSADRRRLQRVRLTRCDEVRQ